MASSSSAAEAPGREPRRNSTGSMTLLLLISVFVIATCGLVYELIAGTLASYLLGDSVTQFSTVIGCYLFAMGIGSWLSRYITRQLLMVFIQVEILIGAVGGSSAAVLFLMFEHVESFRVLLYFMVGLIGMFVGIEIPLLLRILKDKLEFKDLVSKIFTFDYIGALFASILFPLWLVPQLGLVKTSFLFGIFNVGVAIWLLYALRENIPLLQLHRTAAIATLCALTLGLVFAEPLVNLAEADSYQGKVIYAESTPYQRIVLTRERDDVRLFLNGNLQFNSRDEYRYHEALVHPALAALDMPRRVLIIGGGDGLALREVLKYSSIEHITLVDLDARMTQLFSTQPLLVHLNDGALASNRLTLIHQDAFLWVKSNVQTAQREPFDAIVVDVPDPSSFSIGKLYSITFFRELQKLLSTNGLMVVQSTSPWVARKTFWCVNHTLEQAGFYTAPYHAYVPSFGEWGYVIAGRQPYSPPTAFPANLRFVSREILPAMFSFPMDMARVDTTIQRLDDQALVRYFDAEWGMYASAN